MTLEGAGQPSKGDQAEPADPQSGGLFSTRTFVLLTVTLAVSLLVGLGAGITIGMLVGKALGIAWGLLAGLAVGGGTTAFSGIGMLAALHAIVKRRE